MMYFKGSILMIVSFVLVKCSEYHEASNNAFYPDAKEDIKNYSGLEKPFRMQKINLVWDKVRPTLTENKLRKLYSELKMQDKHEITLKRLKSEGGDKEGIKEAEIRKSFNNILVNYGVAGGVKESDDNHAPLKAIFKDKKLTRLWEKAEKSGLTNLELVALQQEFQHHQDKLDEYNQLLELATNTDSRRYNEIQKEVDKEDLWDIRDTNEIHKTAKEVKRGYDRLHKLAINQAGEDEFNEPKVNGLWKLALDADFEPAELESLRMELVHYERRITKMQFLKAELQLVDERHGGKYGLDGDNDKAEGRNMMDRKLAKHTEAITKIHEDLENKIMARHAEL